MQVNATTPSGSRRIKCAVVGASVTVVGIMAANSLGQFAQDIVSRSEISDLIPGIRHQVTALKYFHSLPAAEFCEQVAISGEIVIQRVQGSVAHVAQTSSAVSCGVSSLLRRKRWEKWLLATEVGCAAGSVIGACSLGIRGTSSVSRIILGVFGSVMGAGLGTVAGVGMSASGSIASRIVGQRDASDHVGFSVVSGVGAYMACNAVGRGDCALPVAACVGGLVSAYRA